MEMDETRVERGENNDAGNGSVQTGQLREFKAPRLRHFSTPKLIPFGAMDSAVQSSGGTGADGSGAS